MQSEYFGRRATDNVDRSTLTDHDLLIRIDERLENAINEQKMTNKRVKIVEDQTDCNTTDLAVIKNNQKWMKIIAFVALSGGTAGLLDWFDILDIGAALAHAIK